jgi:hypothetical protein
MCSIDGSLGLLHGSVKSKRFVNHLCKQFNIKLYPGINNELLFKDAGPLERRKYRDVIIDSLRDTNNGTFEASSTDFLKSFFKSSETHNAFGIGQATSRMICMPVLPHKLQKHLSEYHHLQ